MTGSETPYDRAVALAEKAADRAAGATARAAIAKAKLRTASHEYETAKAGDDMLSLLTAMADARAEFHAADTVAKSAIRIAYMAAAIASEMKSRGILCAS